MESVICMVSQPGQIFIGRQPEMAVLTSALDGALLGQGCTVMLAGEPGIGKTRTVQELASYAKERSAQVHLGWCDESQGAPPYWPWVRIIRSSGQQCDAGQLQSEMGNGATNIADVVPEIKIKISGLKPSPTLEPEAARFRLFESITSFLKNASRSQPLMLVLDDIHWADTPSLLLFQYLARELAREGLQEARRSVLGLMPHALERATLDTALQEEVARFEAEGRSKIAFTQSGKRRELPPDVQTVLLRICQESLTNIRRHAEASQVDVTLDYQEHEVLLCVQDNGAGFDPPSVEKEKRGVSFGLTGMRQRAEQINGQLIVESAQNQGTLVRLSIPTP